MRARLLSDRNQGAKLEATYNLAKAYEEQRAARIRTTNELNRTYTELSHAFMQVTELRDTVLEGSKEVFEASTRAYAEGKLDYLNVLDAQRTYFASQIEYIDTLEVYHKAKTKLENIIGQQIDGSNIPESEDQK